MVIDKPGEPEKTLKQLILTIKGFNYAQLLFMRTAIEHEFNNRQAGINSLAYSMIGECDLELKIKGKEYENNVRQENQGES